MVKKNSKLQKSEIWLPERKLKLHRKGLRTLNNLRKLRLLQSIDKVIYNSQLPIKKTLMLVNQKPMIYLLYLTSLIRIRLLPKSNNRRLIRKFNLGKQLKVRRLKLVVLDLILIKS